MDMHHFSNDQLVQYQNQADLKVFVVDYSNQADLHVYRVDYSNQAQDNKGLWFEYFSIMV